MKYLARYLWVGLLLTIPVSQIKSASTGCCPTTTSSCCPSTVNTTGCCETPRTVFVPMSQGQNLYTQYHKPMYLSEDSDCCWDADFSVTYRFNQTRNACQIAKSMFQYPSLTFVGGADDTARQPNALVPEYFGMGNDTDTVVGLSPRIRNNIIDLQLALGGEKFWLQLNLPITNTNWQINKNCAPCGTPGTTALDTEAEGSISQGATPATSAYLLGNTTNTGLESTTFANGTYDNAFISDYFTNNGALYGSFEASSATALNSSTMYFSNWGSAQIDGNALNGTTGTGIKITQSEVSPATTITQALGTGFTYGDVAARKYGNFNFGCNCGGTSTSKWGLADVILQLGYDFCKSDEKHFAAYVRAVFPTGTKLDSCWAQNIFSPIVGNGRHFELGAGINGHWSFWECDDSDVTLNYDGYLTHMFGSNTTRQFDIKGLPMSRYAVVKQLTGDSDFTYEGVMAPLGNFNNGCFNTTFGVRGEAVLDLIYSVCNWEMGLGYAFSGQSSETTPCCNTTSNTTTTSTYVYGFKGNANLVTLDMAGGGANSDAYPANNQTAVTPSNGTFSAGSDNEVAPILAGAYLYGISDSASATNTFTLPQFNCTGLMGGQMLNRIFAHVDYVWRDHCWQPELGVLGSVGFGSGSQTTAQYWDLGLRLGFAF